MGKPPHLGDNDSLHTHSFTALIHSGFAVILLGLNVVAQLVLCNTAHPTIQGIASKRTQKYHFKGIQYQTQCG